MPQITRSRFILTLIALAVAASTFAEETHRYLIATKRPVRLGARGGAVDLAQRLDSEHRGVVPFEAFTGFAADLTEQEARDLRTVGDVRWIEPVVERRALGIERNLAGQTVPYGIRAVQAPFVWGAPKLDVVNVVVMDTGIEATHPDLAGLVAGGFSMFGETTIIDPNGHGTHVAGTIAAADNGLGVVGVAPNVRLWSVRVLNSAGLGTTEGILKGLDWIVKQKRELGGNWVVNLSLGDSKDSPGEHEAFQVAAAEGILIVAAAGNASTAELPAPVAYPAAYSEVVAVGAVDGLLAVAEFSSQGPEVDLSAPGVNILSSVPMGTGSITYVIDGFSIYDAMELEGSKRGVITGEYVFCGLGRPEDFPASVSGRIALIERGGDIRFSDKTRRAKEAGATAVLIYNHSDTSRAGFTLKPPDDIEAQTYDWPVTLSLSMEDGAILRQRGSGSITMRSAPDDYGYKNGTSMASPHVAGAAALLWSIAPDATVDEIVAALTETALDRGTAGPDPVFGAGVVDVHNAAKRLVPGAFVRTGRAFLRRGRG